MQSRPFLVPAVLLTAALLTLSGCVRVHGEEVSRPAVTKAEARRVLDNFARLNNRANEEFDTGLNARIEDGGLGAIDQAGLTVRKADYPEGNPEYEPLEFSDTRYHIPEQAGWPRWFVADAATNRGDEFRWLLVFRRSAEQGRWQATHLSLLTAEDRKEMGDFATDRDGNVEAVPPRGGSQLVVAPRRLGQAYADFLQDTGDGAEFAPGQHTTERRAAREKHLRTPEYVTQYIDQATPAYDTVALRLERGGALVLFSSRHFVKQTVAEGRTVTVSREAEVLLEGTADRSLTLERVSQQAVLVPTRAEKGDGIVFFNRLQGLVGAEGG